MRYVLISFLALLLVTVAILGVRGQLSSRPPLWIFPDMQDQPKYKPLGKSDFFADGRASRPLVEGTVARDPASLQEDRVFYTGKQGAVFVATLPVPVTRQLLERGQQRFNIYCSPCHDRTGSGEGMVVKPLDFVAKGSRGLIQPALKCRGPEYLRIIYGPEYTMPANLERLRKRGLSAKRSLALREFALGIEGLERFVRREPLRRVHECAFAVLALESEPVDPRL